MYCRKCGASLADNSTFCFRCGEMVSSESAAVQGIDTSTETAVLQSEVSFGKTTLLENEEDDNRTLVLQSEAGFVERPVPVREATIFKENLRPQREHAVTDFYVPKTEPVVPKPRKKKGLLITLIAIITVVCLAVVGATIVIVSSSDNAGKEELHAQIMKDWDRVEGSDGDFYTLKLNFAEDKIEYWYESYYENKLVSTYSYEVVSKNKIRIKETEKTYTVEFNSDNTMMMVSPSITNSDSYECWFRLDK